MKYVQPINPDTLVAIHATWLSLKGELDDDLLTSILWGERAYGAKEGDGIERMYIPPISEIVVILLQHEMGALPCTISFTKEEADYLRKTAVMQKRLKTGESKDRGILTRILKGTHVETPLSECASVISLILEERKRALSTFETSFVALGIFEHPILINFLAESSRVADTFEAILRAYLSAYRAGRISWNTNAKKWAENRKRMMTMLGGYESFDTVWLTEDDIETDYSAWRCDHPVETLLALVMEGTIAIEAMAEDGESGLRFRVKPFGLPARTEGKDFHNLRTEKMMIWNTESPKLRERFNEGWLYLLWLYLLDHIGKRLLREDIARHLEEAMPDKGKVNLDKIFEGLIQKLQNVSGETREAVDDWFEKDSTHLFLKSG